MKRKGPATCDLGLETKEKQDTICIKEDIKNDYLSPEMNSTPTQTIK